MMQQRLFSCILLVLVMSACSTDFRSSTWGDSIEQVKQAEGEQEWVQSDSPDGTQSAIYYEGQVEDLKAVIFFAFSNNELFWGKHIFMENHPIPEDYYSDYAKVNKTLQEKLGSKETEYQFNADSDKGYPEKWGQAIYEGELLIQTKWSDEKSEVLHAIFGKNNELTHVVEYHSTLWEE